MKGERLLDTHVWPWFAMSNPLLRQPSRQSIGRAVNGVRLHVSIMSIWEISSLESKGRLHPEMSVESWMERALALPGLKILPQGPELITEDRKILDYARQGYVRAHATDDKELLKP